MNNLPTTEQFIEDDSPLANHITWASAEHQPGAKTVIKQGIVANESARIRQEIIRRANTFEVSTTTMATEKAPDQT